MNAAIAALIGAAAGASATLLTALLNPFNTAKHARKARNFELRREAYADGLGAIYRLMKARNDPTSSSTDEQAPLIDAMNALTMMRLVANPDVADQFRRLINSASQLTRSAADSGAREFSRDLEAFREAARSDLGVDDT